MPLLFTVIIFLRTVHKFLIPTGQWASRGKGNSEEAFYWWLEARYKGR
jgi:hypothetical protein